MKPMRMDIQSPKKVQLVAPQNEPWSNKIKKKIAVQL